jgi:hypothetical protein
MLSPLFRFALAVVVLGVLSGAGRCAGLRVLPAEINLDGPGARQRLIVVVEQGGRVVADRTPAASFGSSRPEVVRIAPGGTAESVGDGEAVVTATVAGERAEAKVRVRKARVAEEPSFRNHIIPIMTRLGCNSGACHGALAGKGGLKLSLRGYAPSSA